MSLKWKKISLKIGITILVVGVAITLICIPLMMKDSILAKEADKKKNEKPKTHMVYRDENRSTY